MKKIIKLTESDLTRIVKRVVTESHEESSLYQALRDALSSSNYPPEDKVDTLRRMADEIESGVKMRKDLSVRWEKENERARRIGGLDPRNKF